LRRCRARPPARSVTRNGAVLAAGAVLVITVVSLSPATGQSPPPGATPTTAVPTEPTAAVRSPSEPDLADGQALFAVACSTCHGTAGGGTDRGPSLIGVGAASADFYLSTGRMPLDEPRAQAERKKPAYSPTEIRKLTAYVASLGPSGPLSGIPGPRGPLSGPPVPEVYPERGDLAEGNVLYANNCAACHSSAGAGGALGHAVYAPPLHRATSLQVAEAIRIGPGAMPVFGPETFDDHQVDSIALYVRYLRDPRDRGGFGLGHLGPIPEGFIAWFVGLGAVLIIARFIGTKD